MVSNILNSNNMNSYCINEDKFKINDNNFSLISEETSMMLKEELDIEKRNGEDAYVSTLLKDADNKASINKNKIQEEINPYIQSNLPDWIYTRAKNIFAQPSNYSTPISTSNAKPTESNLNTALTWFSTMLTLNAIAMSDGLKDMKINEEQVDWEEVFSVTAKGFKNNTKQTHTDEIGDKYRKNLDSPASPYYFYSEEEKTSMVAQFKTDNHKLNSDCFNASLLFLETMRNNYE